VKHCLSVENDESEMAGLDVFVFVLLIFDARIYCLECSASLKNTVNIT
jgi:hypothetical protein